MNITDAVAAVAEALRASTVEVRGGAGSRGSGVIWREDGLVVTNAHVVQGADRLEVLLPDGRLVAAQLVARDPARDLAALATGVRGLEPAVLGDLTALRAGHLVLALGHPLGLGGALAFGIVHSVDRDAGARPRWIRADVRLAPGNSGGPLADARGGVLGINTMIADGLGLAIPHTAVSRFLGAAARAAA